MNTDKTSENAPRAIGASDFLNHKSMMTPGGAGTLVMLLSNSIVFAFPNIFAFHSVAFLLSLLLSGSMHSSLNLNMKTRLNYWIVNSLIIFSMAVGTSNIGVNMIGDREGNHGNEIAQAAESLVISPVKAEQIMAERGTVRLAQRRREPRRTDRNQTRERNRRSRDNSSNSSSGQGGRFFQRW